MLFEGYVFIIEVDGFFKIVFDCMKYYMWYGFDFEEECVKVNVFLVKFDV